MTIADSGPSSQDGLTIEATDLRFSGKTAVIDEDIASLQLEREAVLVVRGIVASVGTKIAKGDVVRVPVFKITEGRVVHDSALRGRLLNQMGFEDDGAPSIPASAIPGHLEERAAALRAEAAATVPAASEQSPLFDDGVGTLVDEPPIAPVKASAASPGDWGVRDLDAPADALDGDRIEKIAVSDAKLAAFMDEL